MSPIPDIAMYYPYIHIRDDNWLKAAALYWPRLARLAPSGYPQYDSEVAKTLDGELGFMLNIAPPAGQVNQVAADFLDFISDNHAELKRRYDPEAEADCLPLWHDVMNEMAGTPGRLHHGWVHVEKMSSALRHVLVHHGLGRIADHDNWVVTHPAIGAAYLVALADRVAKANQLAVVTDQPRLHELHGGGIGQEFADFLIGEPGEPVGRVRPEGDIATLYASLAIKAVIPKNIEDVPVKKIVKARTKLAAEFDVFREHLTTLAEDFTDLTQVDNAAILQERLRMMVDRDLRRPTVALERSLRQLGLEPAKAVLGAKTLELPALAAAAATAAGVPGIVGQAGLAGFKFLTSSTQAQTKRRDARQASPVGYLLGLKRQIGRRGVIERLRHPFG